MCYTQEPQISIKHWLSLEIRLNVTPMMPECLPVTLVSLRSNPLPWPTRNNYPNETGARRGNSRGAITPPTFS